NAKEDDWVKLAGKDERAREIMRRLYHLFEQAPVLGSLIQLRRTGGTLFASEFERVRPLLEQALATERSEDTFAELAIAAQGVVQAARILTCDFTLVVTNVPYLARGKQTESLKEYCEKHHSDARTDLATCMLERCLAFAAPGGATALVITQHWL